MKKLKLFLVSLMLFAFVVPFMVRAEGEDGDSTTGEIERSKINVYMFRGEGCGFCASALSFFDSIEEEYGKYYNLVTYEVWNDADNALLMEEVADYLGVTIKGVPFIIVGGQTYPGFQESWGEDIKSDIVEEYNKNDDERTDIIADLQNGATKDKSSTSDIVISVVSILVIGGIVAFVLFARKGNSEHENSNFDKRNDERIKQKDENYVEENVKEDRKTVKTSTTEKKKSTKKKESSKANTSSEKKSTKKKTSSKK